MITPCDDSLVTAANSLRRQCPSFTSYRDADLYALPEQLLNALAIEVPLLITGDALNSEYAFASSLQQHRAVGIRSENLIRCSLFEHRTAVTVTLEDYRELGWERFGLTLKDVNKLCGVAETRAVPFHQQLCAYAGWLMTNPRFLVEVTGLQQREREYFDTEVNPEGARKHHEEFEAFLDKWQLSRMASWDLPEPLGPHLAGVEPPNGSRRAPEEVALRIPLSMEIPVRAHIRDIVAEIRRDKAASHLDEWQAILDRDGKSSMGLQRFNHILKIQFFRNIVLASRYGERFDGHVQAIDRAFGRFLGLSEDSAKRIRFEISRRLQNDGQGPG